MAYFISRHRSMCAAVLISRTTAMTAVPCVVDAAYEIKHNGRVNFDRSPINLVIGSDYRHMRRGIKIEVIKLIVPKFPESAKLKGMLISKTIALMVLESLVPDIVMEFPPRGVIVDTKGTIKMDLYEECFTAGWHYFVSGDVIHPGRKFPLKDSMLHAQFVTVVKIRPTCETLQLKYNAAMTRLWNGHPHDEDSDELLCAVDPTRFGQLCHGTFGSPLICKNTVVGLLVSPDAQWTNCTGKSNIFHLIGSPDLHNFFNCTQKLFDPEFTVDQVALRKKVYENGQPDLQDMNYDNVLADFDEESENWEEEQFGG